MAKDTHRSGEWIQQRVRPGAAIATGPFGIVIPDSAYRTITIPFLAEESASRHFMTRDGMRIAIWCRIVSTIQIPARAGALWGILSLLRYASQELASASEIKPVAYQPGRRSGTLRLRHFASALRQFIIAALESVPESTKASNFLRDLTVILIQKGKLQKAQQVLLNIISVEPENLEARYTLARVHITLGDNERALTQVQYIALKDPSRPEVFVFAGDVLMNLGRGEEAEQSFRKAIALNNRYQAAYEDLIEYYTRSKQDVKLLATLKRYRGLVPRGTEMGKDISATIIELEKKNKPAKR
jgi:tetratricopeptide (TPR) repeat protein